MSGRAKSLWVQGDVRIRAVITGSCGQWKVALLEIQPYGDTFARQNKKDAEGLLLFSFGQKPRVSSKSFKRQTLWWKEVGSNKAGVCFIGLSRPVPLVIKKDTKIHKGKASRNFPVSLGRQGKYKCKDF